MSFNTINYTVFGIPPYLFFSLCAFVVGVSLYIILIGSKKYPIDPCVISLAIAILGLGIFARMFGYFSGIYRAVGVGETITFDVLKKTGIVFYGGLVGVLITYRMCQAIFKKKMVDLHTIDLLAVSIPLFHAIARVGCFMAGCCYGVESESIFSVKYTIYINGTENTAYRIPIQLIESIYEICIYLYLVWLVKRPDWKSKNILLRYLFIYSTGRFVFEFYRGDANRGIVNGLSFSQFLSVIIWLFLGVKFVIKIMEVNHEENIS